MIKYLYCINDFGEDFITTSFDLFDNGQVTIYNFNGEIDISKLEYAAIDYTNSTIIPSGQYHNGWGSQKYHNSDHLKFYEVSFIEQDIERKTAILKLSEIHYNFNLRTHKRDLKIKSIIT